MVVAIIVLCIVVGLIFFVEFRAKDDDDLRIFVYVLIAIGFVILASTLIVSCNRQKEFNDKAKICGLGCYDNEGRITAVLDSLCNHNCVKFGELLIGHTELRDRYLDNSAPNDYIVGCRDTISGDVLEIELEVYSTLNEDSVIEYGNRITKITLKNANGIAKSDYSIDSDYLSGGSGFEKGYCAVLNDTCAMIFKR